MLAGGAGIVNVMDLAAFLVAVLGLLAAPGPTNTLIALAGAQGSPKSAPARILQLIPAELLGYLTVILPLALLGNDVLSHWSMASNMLKVAAALWVLVLAVRLWGKPDDDPQHREVTPFQVFLTTLLNPKALVVALVLLPPASTPGFAERLALFLCLAAGVAVGWGHAGTLIGTDSGSDNARNRLQTVRRIASLWLALISGTLLLGVLRA